MLNKSERKKKVTQYKSNRIEKRKKEIEIKPMIRE